MTAGPLDRKTLKGIDFLDLGASTGGSLRYCARRFGGRGLGIDIDARKVAGARDAGFEVVHADATSLGVTKAVRYVAAMDFLEHLPDVATARSVLRSATEAATDFLFIRHPSFEGEHYLRTFGINQYWHHWSGHPNHLRVSDYLVMFAELGLDRYAIHHIGPVEDSSHPSIVPSGLVNVHEYDEAAHGPKPQVMFAEPIWRMQHIYVALRPMPAEEWSAIVGPVPRTGER
jgi:SAM-dependent methyltransferase